MIKTFTQDDVIRYIYKETSEQENEAIAQALLTDEMLMDDYKQLSASVETLNSAMLEPSEKAINNILNYSKSIALHSYHK